MSATRFDYVFTFLCGLSVLGLYLDGWAHNHVDKIETFFTPWHGVMYGAFLAITAFTAGVYFLHRRSGVPREEALPVGYGVSLIGIVIYAIAGVGDAIWHALFGIEVRVQALLSPTHLGLLVGATLIRTGPLRAAWQRRAPRGWRALLPMVLSTTFLLSSLTFFTQYVHPFGLTPAARSYEPPAQAASVSGVAMSPDESVIVVGIVSVLLQSVLLMAIVLLLALRFGAGLPFGWLTLLLGLNALLMVWMRERYLSTGPLPLVAVALLSGLAGDLLFRRLAPSPTRLVQTRAFAFALPAILTALYFAAIALFADGVWWSLPVWSGLILLAGAVGWLVSLLALPPPVHASA